VTWLYWFRILLLLLLVVVAGGLGYAALTHDG